MNCHRETELLQRRVAHYAKRIDDLTEKNAELERAVKIHVVLAMTVAEHRDRLFDAVREAEAFLVARTRDGSGISMAESEWLSRNGSKK